MIDNLHKSGLFIYIDITNLTIERTVSRLTNNSKKYIPLNMNNKSDSLYIDYFFSLKKSFIINKDISSDKIFMMQVCNDLNNSLIGEVICNKLDLLIKRLR